MDINKIFLLNVGYSSHNGDWNYEKINSPFTRLYYVTKGEAEIIINGRTQALIPHHMYIIPAFIEHTDRNTGIFEHYYLHICEDAMAGRGLLDTFDFQTEIPATDFDELIFKKLYSANTDFSLQDKNPAVYDNSPSLIDSMKKNHEFSPSERLETMGSIYLLLARFIRSAHPRFHISDPRISKAQKLISEKSEIIFSVEELAAEACMSKDYFIKIFRQELGVTPVQFIINDKLMKAKLMLASTNLTIKEIAYSLGYSDTSYFIRLFKKRHKLSPLQYRKLFND